MGIFMDLVKSRHSCRKYADRPIEREKIEACIEAARLAPSACNSQPWYFAVAYGNTLARKVGATTQKYGVNTFADQPPAFITVWEGPAKLLPAMPKTMDRQFYAQGDVGIAVSYMTLAATDMGLGCCIMGVYDEEVIREALQAPADRKLRYVVAIGYPAADDHISEKSRKPLDEICKFAE